MNKYKYMLVDLSYLLSRNIYSITTWKKPGEYSERDLLKSIFQTISKIPREYGVMADKIVFLSDKWSPEYGGYYRTHLIKDLIDYKGDRISVVPESELQIMSPEEREKVEASNYMLKIKKSVKDIVVSDFSKLGIPTIQQDGWEADDLAFACSNLLYDDSKDQKSILVSNDSDWKYLVSPRMDLLNLPKRMGELHVIHEFDKLYEDLLPEVYRNSRNNPTLYEWYSIMNSLGTSHNNMKKTKKPRANTEKTIIKILNGDMSNVVDVPGYQLQLSTFDVTKFPGFEEVKRSISEGIKTMGAISDSEVFLDFCKKYSIFLNENFYTEMTKHLKRDLYQG